MINNYVTAGVVQTGSGTIDASHATIAANMTSTVSAETKDKLNAIVDLLAGLVS